MSVNKMSIIEKNKHAQEPLILQDAVEKSENFYFILIDGFVSSKSEKNKSFDFLMSHLSKIIYITHEIEEDNFIIIRGAFKKIKMCHMKLILEEIVECLDDGQFNITNQNLSEMS
jgi:hypothetical protein